MDRRALEVEQNGLVHGNLVHGRDLVGRIFARVVGATGVQRRCVQDGSIKRHGKSHLDVSARRATEGHDEHGADHEEVDHGRGGGGGGSWGLRGGGRDDECFGSC